jgi:hypothetical protein
VTGSPWPLQSRTGSPEHKWLDQTTPFGPPGTGDPITRDSPENCPRIRPKLSIKGSPKPLGVLRQNFGEMMNTPTKGYAPKIMVSNSLQLWNRKSLPRTLWPRVHPKVNESKATSGVWGVKIIHKEAQGTHPWSPQRNPEGNTLKSTNRATNEKTQEKAPKITKKEKRERHVQALRNHTESSIHTKEVHTRSTLPPDHPPPTPLLPLQAARWIPCVSLFNLVPFPLCFVHGSIVLACAGEPPASSAAQRRRGPLTCRRPQAPAAAIRMISIRRPRSTQATESNSSIPVSKGRRRQFL